jgi:hypothetical protein
MYPPWFLTHGGGLFCATPDCVANCPQAVDKVVDNFIERKVDGSTSGTITSINLQMLNISFMICPLIKLLTSNKAQPCPPKLLSGNKIPRLLSY